MTVNLEQPIVRETPRKGSRADRARRPRARDALRETAVEFGVCVRPVALRRVDTTTGETEIVDIPCGSTRATICPSCAGRARKLRAQQCREGWHLTEEPELTPDPANGEQKRLVQERAQITAAVDEAADAGDTLTAAACEESMAVVDDELGAAGLRGRIEPEGKPRRTRSTRRRQDTPELPRRPAVASTVGRAYTDPRTGKMFRPSLFVTLTLPSYGRVRDDGTPVDPRRYDYVRAARDALHFGKLIDRWCQNLRRVAGYHVQYFATVEPQKRGAPHAHFAIRGTLPRTLVKELTAATYTQVWWPATGAPVYTDRLPEWDSAANDGDGGYVDPDTREPLLTWDQALDDLAEQDDAEPLHVARFGTQVDVKGVLAGSPEAERCIGYLVKYLVKDLGDDLNPTDQLDDLDDDQGDEAARLSRADAKAAASRRADHIAHLVDVLRYEPCSPRCANWLRYGVQPKSPRPGMRPGCCRAKAHRPSHLGYGGRRVLVSRKWTAKDLADHRHERRAHVLAVLVRTLDGQSVTTPSVASSATVPPPDDGVVWELAKTNDPDVSPIQRRILRAIAHATRWRAQYRIARDGLAPSGAVDSSAIGDIDNGEAVA